MNDNRTSALITALKRNSLDDGPGIRTTVFFKGCPLSCVWCQNPETKSPFQQIAYEAENCVGCLRCIDACDDCAISIQGNGTFPIDRQKCKMCGNCTNVCRSQALRYAGTAYGVDQLSQKLLRDLVFYKNSNGGVTFSGGEPTLYMEYLSCLAQKLKENGVHLCLETCGYYNQRQFTEELLPYLDLVYFDIKIFDREAHKKYCGVYNDTILQNFEMLFRSKKVKLLPRIPLIPNITTGRDNLTAIRDFFKKYGVEEIGLLPYNPLWLSKLPGIGTAAEYSNAEWMQSDEKDGIKEIFKDFKFRDF